MEAGWDEAWRKAWSEDKNQDRDRDRDRDAGKAESGQDGACTEGQVFQGGEAVLEGSALMYGGINLPVVWGDHQGFCFLLEQVERKE